MAATAPPFGAVPPLYDREERAQTLLMNELFEVELHTHGVSAACICTAFAWSNAWSAGSQYSRARSVHRAECLALGVSALPHVGQFACQLFASYLAAHGCYYYLVDNKFDTISR